MNPIFSLALATALFLSSCATAPSAHSEAQAQEAPSPNAVSIEASQNTEFPPTVAEKKKLNADFKKALATEEATLNKKERTDSKAFAVGQNTAKKNWLAQEKKDRRVFFDKHMSGPERRQYIQDYLKRKEAYDLSQKNELATFKSSWKEKRDYLKKFQKERSDQFKVQIDQGKRPDVSLWPRS